MHKILRDSKLALLILAAASALGITQIAPTVAHDAPLVVAGIVQGDGG